MKRSLSNISFLFLFFISYIPGVIYSQESAEGIFREIIENYAGVDNVSGEITQIIKTPLSKDVYTFSVKARKEGYIKVEYNEIDQLIISDGTFFYIYNGSAKKVFKYILGSVEKYTDINLLSGYILDNYSIKKAKDSKKLVFYGLSSNVTYPIIMIWYDSGYYVDKLGLDDGGGNVFEFEIDYQNLNAQNPINIFQFEIPEGVECEERGVIFPE